MAERKKQVSGVMFTDSTTARNNSMHLSTAVGENNAPINIVNNYNYNVTHSHISVATLQGSGQDDGTVSLPSDSNPIMIVIGESGAGKSSCCNILIGNSHDSDVFPASRFSKETTQQTKIHTSFFKGNRERPFTIVDTQGFQDPNAVGNSKEANQAIIVELMKNITKIPHINLFAVCINGTTLRRINESLLYMLRTFEEVFGHMMKDGVVIKDKNTFWKNCVIVVTNLIMDRKTIKKRVGSYDIGAYKEIVRKQISDLTNEMGIEVPSHVIIDATYDTDDENEASAFEEATEKLYDTLVNTAPARTEAMLKQHALSLKEVDNTKATAELVEQEKQKLEEKFNGLRQNFDRKTVELKEKFEWLGVPETKCIEAISKEDQPDFFKLATLFKKELFPKRFIQQLTRDKSFDDVLEALAGMTLEKYKEFLEKKLPVYLELKRKFAFLGTPHQRFIDAWDQVDQPEFTNLAELLKKELVSSRRFRQLMYPNNFEEVITILAPMTLNECKKLLEEEIRYERELKPKLLWLGISDDRIEDAISQVEQPKFSIICNELRLELSDGKNFCIVRELYNKTFDETVELLSSWTLQECKQGMMK